MSVVSDLDNLYCYYGSEAGYTRELKYIKINQNLKYMKKVNAEQVIYIVNILKILWGKIYPKVELNHSDTPVNLIKAEGMMIFGTVFWQ